MNVNVLLDSSIVSLLKIISGRRDKSFESIILISFIEKKKHQDRWSDSLITIVFCLTDTCSYLNKRNDCSLCTCHSHEKKEEEGKHTDTYIQSTLYCENNIGQNIERKKKKDKLALHFHPSVIFIYNDRCRPYFAIHINNIQHSD